MRMNYRPAATDQCDLAADADVCDLTLEALGCMYLCMVAKIMHYCTRCCATILDSSIYL